jgi:hypothetical protein
MIVVILAGILGLWLAGNRHPAGWGLAAAAHLLWLPYAWRVSAGIRASRGRLRVDLLPQLP